MINALGFLLAVLLAEASRLEKGELRKEHEKGQ
jgi:hypothetical protein